MLKGTAGFGGKKDTELQAQEEMTYHLLYSFVFCELLLCCTSSSFFFLKITIDFHRSSHFGQ